MNGLAELITIKHYWEQWSDARLIIAVLHNNVLNQVTWEIRAMEGAPKFTESQQLPDVSYEGFARSLGLGGIAVDKAEQVRPAWEQALAADRPDPDVPPTPPHATFEQAKDLAKALLHGDPNSLGIVKEGLLAKAREV